ncbi:hypothetical protein Tco_0012290 [Tanacetum coccineum]
MKDFRANKIASDKMTGSFKEHYSILREYAQELINQNPSTTVRIDVQQEPNSKSPIRTFIRVYMCPFPGQILTAVGVDGNNRIYPLAYTIVEAERLIQAIASVFPSAEHRLCVKHIHENMKSEFKGGVYKDMLWNAARATVVVEFNKYMGQLKSYNSAAYDWKWELIGIPCKHVVVIIYNMSKNEMRVVGRPPKNRKKSVDELSQGARQAAGARNVFSQAAVTSQQSQAPRQVVGARNASSQANGSSQQKKGPRQGAGARNASSQTAGSSQPRVAPSQASQGPSQHSAGPTQASQGPKQGFQAPRPTPYYGSQRLTKKSTIRQPSETTILFQLLCNDL